MREQEGETPMLCAGCLMMMSHPPRCENAACHWEEAKQPERQEHLPRHHLLFNRYYIGRVLGQGGFGITYLALDTELDRQMAIKEYLPREHCSRLTDRMTVRSHGGEKADLFNTGLHGFLNEAKNIARLDGHPNIVSITDHVKANGTAYMVMQFVPGKTLKEYLAERGGRIPYAVARDIMLHVMSGLRKAHQHGVLHRDISPDNIMVSSQGPVKIIDFGAARQASAELPGAMTIILKPGYAPEEQYRTRGKQGAWTDVYAVAATLYRCIAGQPPPEANDRLADDELVRPTAFCPDMPPHAEAALLKGLAVKAADRYQTIDQFQEALLGRAGSKPLQQEEEKRSSVRDQPPRQEDNARNRPAGQPKQGPTEAHREKIPPTAAGNETPAKPWFLAPATLALLGVLVLAAAGLAIYWHNSSPRDPAPAAALPQTSSRTASLSWEKLPYNDSALEHCDGVQGCLDRKAKAEALLAVRDWAAVDFASALFTDCMNYQPCLDRERHRTELLAITDWQRVGKKDTILQDCMHFGPCVEREATLSTPQTSSGENKRSAGRATGLNAIQRPREEETEQFSNYANCKDSPNPARCAEYKKREGPVYGPSR